MEGEFLTSKEVIQLLNISTRTLTRKVASGDLKATRKKGKLLFPKEQFKGVVEKQEDSLSKMNEAIQNLKEEFRREATKDNGTIKAMERLQEELKREIEDKRKLLESYSQQIQEKDKNYIDQLKVKDTQIQELQKLVDQQQILTKQLQDKFLLLDQPRAEPVKEKPKRKANKKATNSKAKTQPKPKGKKGFWRWLTE